MRTHPALRGAGACPWLRVKVGRNAWPFALKLTTTDNSKLPFRLMCNSLDCRMKPEYLAETCRHMEDMQNLHRHQAQEPNLQPFSWEAKSLGRKQTHSFLWWITEVAANYASIKMPGSYYDYWRLTVRRWDGEIEVFIKLFIILDNDPSICLILSRFGNLAVPNLEHWRKKLNKKFPRGSYLNINIVDM